MAGEEEETKLQQVELEEASPGKAKDGEADGGPDLEEPPLLQRHQGAGARPSRYTPARLFSPPSPHQNTLLLPGGLREFGKCLMVPVTVVSFVVLCD